MNFSDEKDDLFLAAHNYSKEEALDVIEKAILFFRDNGIKGERFAETIERIGFENVEKQLLEQL